MAYERGSTCPGCASLALELGGTRWMEGGFAKELVSSRSFLEWGWDTGDLLEKGVAEALQPDPTNPRGDPPS